jgi:hypothetical protein
VTVRGPVWIGFVVAVVLAGVFFYAGYRGERRGGLADDEGSRLLREKRYPEAAAKYEATVAADPKNDLAWYQLASAHPDAGVAAAAAPPRNAKSDSAADPLLTDEKLSPELRKLVDGAHAHRAVATLEAAGCDQALVMTGAMYNHFADLRYGKKMPAQVEDGRADVVWCQTRMTTPPDCAALAPIFARVAQPRRAFVVFSGYVAPPFSPRCEGTHAKDGKYESGEGPGYPSSRQ